MVMGIITISRVKAIARNVEIGVDKISDFTMSLNTDNDLKDFSPRQSLMSEIQQPYKKERSFSNQIFIVDDRDLKFEIDETM